MTERRHLITAVLLVLALALRFVTLSACGGSDDREFAVEIAFTPTPAPDIPQCRDNELDVTEVCDETAPNGDAACTAQGKSCLCCACLGAGETLGTRTFSITRPGSLFQNNILGCTDASMDPWLPGPLVIEAGRPDPGTCVAPLVLTQDVIFGFLQPIGVACFKLIAAGSEGSIDCDGDTPYDVRYEQNSNGAQPDDPQVVTRGLGEPSIASGDAELFFASRIAVNLQNPPGSPLPNVNECLSLDYDNPMSDPRVKPADISTGPLGFTTRNAEAVVINPVQGGAELNCPGAGELFAGVNFSCGRWTQENSEGTLIAPLSALGQLNGALDTANVAVIKD
jgi:hypothetical protein